MAFMVKINGTNRSLDVDGDTPLLWVRSPSGSAGARGNSWLKPGDRIHAEIGGIGQLNVCMRDD
jgi:hypothetical protein